MTTHIISLAISVLIAKGKQRQLPPMEAVALNLGYALGAKAREVDFRRRKEEGAYDLTKVEDLHLVLAAAAHRVFRRWARQDAEAARTSRLQPLPLGVLMTRLAETGEGPDAAAAAQRCLRAINLVAPLIGPRATATATATRRVAVAA